LLPIDAIPSFSLGFSVLFLCLAGLLRFGFALFCGVLGCFSLWLYCGFASCSLGFSVFCLYLAGLLRFVRSCFRYGFCGFA
jgi:hypothetical protein